MEKTTFDRIRAIVYEHSGISLKETKEAMVSARIAKRMRALAINSHEDYVDYLDQDKSGDEITFFLDVISTNVTSFFREIQHFEYLKNILRNWIANGKTKVRIWSAAASTGEEALSIAMAVQEVIGERPFDYKILATDISTSVLSRAQQGTYDAGQMQNVPESQRRRYFQAVRKGDATVYRVCNKLKRRILYRRLNLSRPPFPMRSQLDIVFCRNVMIYFNETIRNRLVAEIHRQLLPGGYLFTGHAESLSSLKTSFTYIQPTLYQKKL
jgi:chemotaxis protein methyltransferase CheR